MSTKKIEDIIKENSVKQNTRKVTSFPEIKTCRHPEHDPPRMRVFEPGGYEHTCPSCGNVQTFTIGSKPELSRKAQLTGEVKSYTEFKTQRGNYITQ